MADNSKQPWRKILYEKQPYPDNYVDSSFLQQLRKNLHVRCYDFKTLMFESASLSQQISSISLFVTMYFYMEDGSVSPQMLWCLASLVTVAGYLANTVILWRAGHALSLSLFMQHLRSCVLFQCLGALLSPILVSLTETISTDTIYAMTTLMLLANFCFCNYDYSGESEVPGPLCLNAAVFASVCLASRLHTAWHAFTTVSTSFQLFALGPLLRKNLKLWWAEAHVAVTLVSVVVCCAGLVIKSPVGSVLYLLATLFTMVVCPLWLFTLQKHKNNIYGPWDEAVIKES